MPHFPGCLTFVPLAIMTTQSALQMVTMQPVDRMWLPAGHIIRGKGLGQENREANTMRATTLSLCHGNESCFLENVAALHRLV